MPDRELDLDAPAHAQSLTFRWPRNWTAVVFFGLLGALHLTMAATVLMLLPAIVLFLFAQRSFVRGITFTGVKG